MNRPKRKKYVLGFIPESAMPLVLIGLGVLVIGGAAAVWLSNRSDPNNAPAVTGAPALEVEQSHFELGDRKFNEMAEVTYVLRNVGDKPLQITRTPIVEVVEGC